MTRETGFYLTVTGLSIYAVLVMLIFCIPVQEMLKTHTINESFIPYIFLSIIFYPISIILIYLGHKGLKFFNLRWTIGLSILPFVLAIGILARLN